MNNQIEKKIKTLLYSSLEDVGVISNKIKKQIYDNIYNVYNAPEKTFHNFNWINKIYDEISKYTNVDSLLFLQIIGFMYTNNYYNFSDYNKLINFNLKKFYDAINKISNNNIKIKYEDFNFDRDKMVMGNNIALIKAFDLIYLGLDSDSRENKSRAIWEELKAFGLKYDGYYEPQYRDLMANRMKLLLREENIILFQPLYELNGYRVKDTMRYLIRRYMDGYNF